MKDAYSFHADEASAETVYKEVFEAYKRIFTRCGLRFRPVEADTGAIGGNFSHEFMVLASTGEETIASCDACGYAANIERAEALPPAPASGTPAPIEEVPTPGLGAVEKVAAFLNVPAERFIKTVFYLADGKPVVALVRGDLELNEPKLQRALGAKLMFKAGEDVYRQTAGCAPGFAGPVGLGAHTVADPSVMGLVNAVTGANKNDTHLKNVNPGRDFTPGAVADIRNVREKDPCPKCKHPLSFHKGIEVGHTFKLGTKYSQAMDAGFLTEKGAKTPFIMGCYGIGVSRVVAAAIEQSNDENGIVWPEALAPFDVAVLPLYTQEPRVMAAAEALEKALSAEGWEVLLDDRDQRAGVKFKDADLFGLPYRVTVGEKKLAQGMVEIKRRSGAAAQDVPLDDAVRALRDMRKGGAASR
jgi:prolyl-tRNA synthetase